jgi:hypothetical protein
MRWRPENSGRRRKEPNGRTNGRALAERGVAHERRGWGSRGSNNCAEDEACAGVARDGKGVATCESYKQAVTRKTLQREIKYRSGRARTRRDRPERRGQR